jgi:hypothetical protein
MIALIALSALTVAAALLCGGSLVGWGRVHVHWSPMAILSMVILLLLYNPPIDRQEWAMAWGSLVWIACMGGLCAVLVRNAWAEPAVRAAWSVAAFGVGLNLLVVCANGGLMPQSASSWLLTNAETSAPAKPGPVEPHLKNVKPIDDETRLAWLGDVIPEPSWVPNPIVVSIGDVLLGLGLAWWAFATTCSDGRTRKVAA